MAPIQDFYWHFLISRLLGCHNECNPTPPKPPPWANSTVWKHSAGSSAHARWAAFDKNWVRLIWPDQEEQPFVFDYVWKSFRDKSSGETYRILR